MRRVKYELPFAHFAALRSRLYVRFYCVTRYVLYIPGPKKKAGGTLADLLWTLARAGIRPHFSNFGPTAERKPSYKMVFGLGER